MHGRNHVLRYLVNAFRLLLGIWVAALTGCGNYQDRNISVSVDEVVGTWRFDSRADGMLREWGQTSGKSAIRFSGDMSVHMESFPFASGMGVPDHIDWLTGDGTWYLKDPVKGAQFIVVVFKRGGVRERDGGFWCVREGGVLHIEVTPDRSKSIEAGTVTLVKDEGSGWKDRR